MIDNTFKTTLFKRCLKREAEVHAASRGKLNTAGAMLTAARADEMKELILDLGLEEEYRSFYYTMALRAAGEVLDRAAS